KGKDQTRVYLANALVEVSGLPIKSLAEAVKLIDALPHAIATRVFRIYKGQCPPNHHFSTAALFKAPEPAKYAVLVEKNEDDLDDMADRARASLEARFGRKEV